MATFFKSSRIWVLDYTYDGRARRWFKALPQEADAQAVLAGELQDLYGKRARLVGVRPATADEETQYLHGTLPKNVLCPTGRGPVQGQAARATDPGQPVRPADADPAGATGTGPGDGTVRPGG